MAEPDTLLAMRVTLAIAILAAVLGGCSDDSTTSGQVEVMIPVTGGELRGIDGAGECATSPASGGPAVLFLHGASFNAGTWVETDTHERLCEEGIPSISIDLPGFGQSPRFDHDPVRLLDDVIDFIGQDVILVAPSMSGNYAFPWLVTNPPRAAGFVPVAPVGITNWTPPSGFAVPTRAIWGSEDTTVPVDFGEELVSSIFGATLEVVPGGGHAVYRTDPDEFHDLLLEFVAGLRS